MMSTLQKVDALYDMAVTEQENGTAKLAEAGVDYDDGTIQGVMEHIPTEGGKAYTNGIYVPGGKKLDIDDFTPVYDPAIPFGHSGTRVAEVLSTNDEDQINAWMRWGWSAYSATYDAEGVSGAYAGYSWDGAKYLAKAKLWLGRYIDQNKTLYATLQYLDDVGVWHDIQDLAISIEIPYPINIFDIMLDASTPMYGLRWIHKQPLKTQVNTITFFGMTLYESEGEGIPVYNVVSSGLIQPPEGYSGFGTLLVNVSD